MFQILTHKLPQFFKKAVDGYIVLVDQKEDYFIYFQFTGNHDTMLVEFELEHESSVINVRQENINQVIYESLMIISSYNYSKIRNNENFTQMLNLFHSELYEKTYL